MSFALPKDIAHQFGISQKTVYNYMSKYGDKILTKKEFGKTLVSVSDFTAILQKVYNHGPSVKNIESSEEPIKTEVGKDIESESNLQKEYKTVVAKSEELEKVLDDKTRQLNKYAQLYTEVKAEKKELEGKYEALQQYQIKRIEAHSSAEIKQSAKYYRLMILTAVVLVLLVVAVILSVYPNLMN